MKELDELFGKVLKDQKDASDAMDKLTGMVGLNMTEWSYLNGRRTMAGQVMVWILDAQLRLVEGE